MFKQKDLQKFVDNNLNVLIEGPHGVGKTEMIKEIFGKNNINYKYFSAPTMDPFTEMVGVPRASQPDANGEQFLEMILPKGFADDTIEALFFDEFNRAPDKITNAVMELMQFKSINGRKFNNLKFIWAAINPYDENETYAVNQLDAAVRDRFHVQLAVRQDYIESKYFTKKYGPLSNVFIAWWKENENYKHVSPRRLDYAISAYNNDIDITYLLPVKANVKDLQTRIKTYLAEKNPKAKSEAEVPVEFSIREDGSYTLEEANIALERKIKISINLKNSLDIIPKIKNDASQHPILNYVHREALVSKMTTHDPGSPSAYSNARKVAYNWMKYFDEALSDDITGFLASEVNGTTWAKLLTFWVRGFAVGQNEAPGMEKSKFYLTYLKDVKLN